MLRHVLMFRFNDYSADEKEEVMNTFSEKLLALKEFIPEIKYISTGKNFSKSPSAFDMIYEVHFESELELDVYRIHSEHVKVLEYMRSLNIKIAVVDYLA